MPADETGAKERIFQATLDLITGGEDAAKITLRRIAQKAGVNLALINYYYQTKENLFSQVVGTMMDEIIKQVSQAGAVNEDAVTRLRGILLTTADAAFQYYNVCKIAIAAELKQGCKNSCEMVMPLLKEIFGGRSESDLKIIALQLLLPFHHIVLEPELYNKCLDVDFFDERQRAQKINRMIDCVLAGASKEAK